MPDILDATGLQVKTVPEILNELVAGYRRIYGDDINVDQNSPDGQALNLFAQACGDIRELLVMINNGFDPDQALGRILDQRVVINNIARAGGTYTLQTIDVVVNQTTALEGLDGAFNDPDGTGYTISDNAGNQFILVDSITLTAGTTPLTFRAKNIGQVETVLNTITNQVVIVLGVVSVNNSIGPLQIGQRQETDPQLRTRRQESPSISSNGYLNGLLAKVLNLSGVSGAKLYENVGSTTDSDGIPGHGIWLIAEGGATADIGQTIYASKSYGANMKGAQTVNIPTDSGGVFVAKFDRPTPESLYIRFDIQKTVTGAVFDTDKIKDYIIDNLDFDIGQYAETSDITAIARAAINATGGRGVPVNVEVSDDNVAWVDFLNTATKDRKWTLDPTRIFITVLP